MANMDYCPEYKLWLKVEGGDSTIYEGRSDMEVLYMLRDVSWLDGGRLQFALAPVELSEHPLKINKPDSCIPDIEDYWHGEDLVHDPAFDRDGREGFHPIENNGEWELLVNGEPKRCTITLLRVTGATALRTEDAAFDEQRVLVDAA